MAPLNRTKGCFPGVPFARRSGVPFASRLTIDPFRVSGLETASFNPLAELSLDSENVAEDAALCADALIEHPERGERHWTESAQALLRALILTTLADANPARRNLVTMRQILMMTDERIGDIMYEAATQNKIFTPLQALYGLLRAQRDKPYGYICVGVAEQLEAMGPEERGSVLSAAKTQTQWLDDQRIQAALSRSDFRMEDLKKKKTTIYLCLPAMRMSTHARWFRLMLLLTLTVMERTKEKPPAPVLFILDEFPVMGHVAAIETAAGLMAGFDVKLWVIVQDIGQLKRHYAKTWQTFVANSGVVTAFGVSDQETLEVLARKLGRMRMVEQVPTGTVGMDMLSSGALRDDRFDVPLLAEHEIATLFAREKKRMLILAAGREPAIAERIEYFDEKETMFEGLYPPADKGK
jgi:type IV secretion system protein VirD4